MITCRYDVREFQGALREILRTSSKAPEAVILHQAKQLTFALCKATPKAKKSDIIRATKPYLWKVVNLPGKGRVRVVPMGTKKSANKTPAIPFHSVGKRISAINYSRLGWYRAAERLGVKFKFGKLGKATDEGSVVLKLSGDNTTVTVTNNTDGIEKNDSRYRILDKAFAGRTADMEKELQRRYQALLDRVKP